VLAVSVQRVGQDTAWHEIERLLIGHKHTMLTPVLPCQLHDYYATTRLSSTLSSGHLPLSCFLRLLVLPCTTPVLPHHCHHHHYYLTRKEGV